MAKITRFSEYSFTESMVDDFINHFSIGESKEDEQSEHIDYILKTYKERFGDRKPTHQQFADFYHELRSEGIDGLLIFDVLDDVVPNPEEDEID
jgi:hypothetical protein